jgi:hypothetical protein
MGASILREVLLLVLVDDLTITQPCVLRVPRALCALSAHGYVEERIGPEACIVDAVVTTTLPSETPPGPQKLHRDIRLVEDDDMFARQYCCNRWAWLPVRSERTSSHVQASTGGYTILPGVVEP